MRFEYVQLLDDRRCRDYRDVYAERWSGRNARDIGGTVLTAPPGGDIPFVATAAAVRYAVAYSVVRVAVDVGGSIRTVPSATRSTTSPWCASRYSNRETIVPNRLLAR